MSEGVSGLRVRRRGKGQSADQKADNRVAERAGAEFTFKKRKVARD